MSPEHETLDQLLGGDLTLQVVRCLFGDDGRFLSGVLGLLENGEVRMIDEENLAVPSWQWKKVLAASARGEGLPIVRLSITSVAIRRVG
jgi:hypothetical protein